MVGDFFLYVGKGFKICPCIIAVDFLYLYSNCIMNIKEVFEVPGHLGN
jgi:hypothetical protein